MGWTDSEMIAEAIKALKDRTGSSGAAISKWILANYKVDPAQLKVHQRLALRRMEDNGTVTKIKASYKLVKKEKAPAKKAPAKKAPAKKTASKKKAPAKKVGMGWCVLLVVYNGLCWAWTH